MIHLKVYSTILGLLIALFGTVISHSFHNTRAGDEALILQGISPLLPSADPGMDNSARYIRHLGLSIPGSAFPDYPGQPDYLPAGIAWPPPIDFTEPSGGIRINRTPCGVGETAL